jgi:O-antigen ligase
MTWLPGLPRAEAGLIIALVAIGLAAAVAIVLGRLRGLEVAGLALIALTPLIPTLPTPLGTGLTSDDVLPITGLAILAVQLYRTGGFRRRPLSRVQLMLIAGLALVVVGGLVSAVLNADGAAQFARFLFKGSGHFAFLGLIAFVVAMTVGRVPNLITPAAQALAWMGSAEAVFGLVAYFVPLPGRLGLAGVKPWSVLHGEVPGRIAGTLGISPDFTGAILMTTLIVTVGLALTSEGRWRAWWLASAIVQLAALVLTFSRAPLAIAAVGVFAVLVLTRRPLLLIPLAVAGAAIALFTPLVGRFLSDANDRLALWAAGLQLMLQHPLAGVGSGESEALIRSLPEKGLVTVFGKATSNAHNTVLLAGAEMGVLAALGALLLNVGLGLTAVFTIRDALAARARDVLLLSIAVALLALLAQGMVNNLFTVAVTGVMIALLTGTLFWSRKQVAAQDMTIATTGPSPALAPSQQGAYRVTADAANVGSDGPSAE